MSFRSLLSWFVTTFFCIALLFLPFAYQLSNFIQEDIIVLISFMFLILKLFDIRERKSFLIESNLLTPFFLLFLLLVLSQYMFGVFGFSSKFLPVSVYPYATRLQFVRLVAYWFLFHMFTQYANGRQSITAVLIVVVVAAYAVSILSLWRYFFKSEFISAHIFGGGINFPVIHPNRNNVASFLELVAPVILGLCCYRVSRCHLMHGKRSAWAALFRDHWFFILSILLLLVFAAAIGTLSKFSIAASLLGLFAFFVMTVSKRNLSYVLLASFVGLILALGVAHWLVGARVMETFSLAKAHHYATLDSRIPLWQRALPLFYSFPFFGTGLGTFAASFGGFQRVEVTYFSTHLLNDYFEILIETGVAGFLIWAGAILTYFIRLRKRFARTGSYFRRFVGAGILSGLLGFFAHEFFIDNLFDPANSFYFLAFLGIGIVLFNEKES